jgi:hypothetical protein
MPVHHRLRLLAFPMRARGGAPPLVRHEISRFSRKERPHMPGATTALGRASARNNAPVRVAFRFQNSVSAQNKAYFAAQWLAYAIPCRRFADALADTCARLGADVVCYAFIAVDLHHLLLADLSAHSGVDHVVLGGGFQFRFRPHRDLRSDGVLDIGVQALVRVQFRRIARSAPPAWKPKPLRLAPVR